MNFLLQIDDAVVLRVHNSLNIVALLTSVLVVTVCFYLRSQSIRRLVDRIFAPHRH